MENRRPYQRHRGGQPHERHRHDLHWDAPLHAVEQVLARILRVAEVARGGDGEDGERACHEVCFVAAKEGHHLGHARHAVFGEGARDHRLGGVGQAKIEAPGVGDFGFDIVGGKRGGQVGNMLQPGAQTHIRSEVGAEGGTHLFGPVIQHFEPGRAGDKVDAVAANIGHGRAVPIKEGETLRRAGQCVLHDGGWKQDAPVGVGRQPGVQEALAQLRAADFHAGGGQNVTRFVDDTVEQVVVGDGQGWAHRSFPSRCGSRWAWERRHPWRQQAIARARQAGKDAGAPRAAVIAYDRRRPPRR